MLKNSLLLFNVVTLFFLNLFFGENVQVMMDAPAEMKRGETYKIELTIQKGSISGFAKLQTTLPAGMSAKMVDGKGASFTFNDQKVKFIWMALPEESEFTIAYELMVAEDAPASTDLSGKFSYIEENQRQTYTIPPQTLTIDTPSEETADGGEAAEPEISATCERMITKKGDNEYEVAVTIKKQGIAGFAKIQENIPTHAKAAGIKSESAVFSTLEGRAKFVWMALPEDDEVTIAYSITSDQPLEEELSAINGEFSFLDNNQTTKVPVTISPDSEYGQEAAMADGGADDSTSTDDDTSDDSTADAGQEEGTDDDATTADSTSDESTDDTATDDSATDDTTADDAGDEDTDTDSDDSASTADSSTDDDAADDSTADDSTDDSTADDTSSDDSSTDDSTADDSTTDDSSMDDASDDNGSTADNNADDASDDSSSDADDSSADNSSDDSSTASSDQDNRPPPSVTNIPSPERGITYKVQICAGHKQVGKEHFKKVYNWDQTYNIENHQGWIKYTIGSFNVYKGARDRRNEVTSSHNFPGPFVTAYNEGERVTVQEALMISNQKWYK